MNLCSNGHDEICYEGRDCPLCDEKSDLQSIIDDLDKQIEEKDKQIESLNNHIEELERGE